MPRPARTTILHPVVLRELEVLAVGDLTPGMRRVTLGGEQLGPFVDGEGRGRPALESRGFDDSFRLFFPAPGERQAVLPTVRDGRVEFPDDPRPLHRVYSVRRHDRDARSLDVDFVTHGVGIATSWAARVQVGDRITVLGPTSSSGTPLGVDWWLVAGDDTALPAIARMLDEAPHDLRAQVFLEIAEESHRQPLRELPGVEVTWLTREGAEAATTTRLLDAVRAAAWWPGRPFAWLAGEQAVVRDLRRHLVEDRRLAKASIDFTGYWKREKVAVLAADPAVPDPTKNVTAYERFHELAELAPPIAIRVAVELGVGDLISRGVDTSAELAARTGSDRRALDRLLRYLRAIDLLAEPVPGRFALTETGEYLADEEWIGELHPARLRGLQDAGLIGLRASVRSGTSSYAVVTGREFSAVRADPGYQRALLEEAAEHADSVAPALAMHPALRGARVTAVRSSGASSEARALVATHPGMRVVISAPVGQVDWLNDDLSTAIPDAAQRARIEVTVGETFDPALEADALLLVHALDDLDDGAATALLRDAAATLDPRGRILLIEHTLDVDHLDEHDASADLSALTRDGTGLRTDLELDALVAEVGLQPCGRSVVGWGLVVRELALDPDSWTSQSPTPKRSSSTA